MAPPCYCSIARHSRQPNEVSAFPLLYVRVQTNDLQRGNTMNHFTTKYEQNLAGVLSGFDRLVFHGTIRTLASVGGMKGYLSYCNILWKDFADHAEKVTERIKQAALRPFHQAERPVVYVPSPKTSKEEQARQIADKDGIREGPICMLTSLELCSGFDVNFNHTTQRLQLVGRNRKCLHLYHYRIDPVLGFLHARLQTWFPFNIQVCLNGREWLAHQMDTEGIRYERRDNCFVWIENLPRAQELMEAQLQANWPQQLDRLAALLNPTLAEALSPFVARYYWTCHQSEWATDLLFREGSVLKRLYPRLVEHGVTTLASPDVLRPYGPLSAKGEVPGAFRGEVTSDLKRRQEGMRIKHRCNHNSIKAYDKAYTERGGVLRIETTLNDPTDFKVYRPKEGAPAEELSWRPMRKGVADLYRRAQVCQKANERYLDALASVDTSQTLQELTEQMGRPTTFKDKRVRGINPFAPEDAALLAAVSRGEFALNGLRNRDLQRLLFATEAATPEEARRRSGQVTRKLRLLRAHGILAKVAHTHRYQVTESGRKTLAALSTARQTPVNQLLAKAA